MTKIKRLVAVALAVLMILGNLSLIASAWDPTVDGGFNLGIDTKIFRSVDGEWVETTKVEQGETVKARVYLSTDYYTNSGNLLFFYNNSFFTDNFSSGNNTLVVNPYYQAAPYLATGVFVGGPQSTSGVEKAMVNRNAITQEFADAHEFVYISYYFDGTSYNQKFNGSKWFCEFDLTVKSDASASDEGAFFAVEATTTTPDFTRGIIDVPKGEYNTKNSSTVSMTDWEAVLSYTSTPVTLFANKVAVSFDANEGSFKNGLTTLRFEGEAGDALAVEDPVRPNFEFKGWVVKDTETDAEDVTAYPAGDTEYVAAWEYKLSTEESVNFETRFYRLDAETGEWIYTEKAKRGEALKARIFVNTSYFTNAGDLIVFYNNQFFTDTYPTSLQQELVVNTEAGSAVANDISGHFAKHLPNSAEIKKLTDHGYITPEFAESHNAFTIEYGFNPSTGKKLTVNDWSNESDEWLFEFDLQVSANATGKDYFWIEQNTIMNPDDGVYAFINVPFSTDGGLNTEVIGLHSVDVNSTVKNNFVELESTITLDADGGVFAENDAEEYVIHDYIGTKVVAPQNPTKEGYTFMGWIDEEGNAAEIPAEQPYEDITLTAVWQAEVDISYDTDGDGTADVTETVTSGEEFVKPEDPSKEGNRFVGWSEDPTGATITGLPDVYPDTDKTYTAIFDPLSYEVNYYVRDPKTFEFKLAAEVPIPFGELIAHVPSSAYKAPEGYTLSEAYSNASLTVLLPDDATMPANEVDVYFKLVPNTYTATFDANGGAWADGTTTKDVDAVYNTQIVAPEDPAREGYNFICWSPYVSIMDEENKTFIATWEEATYNAVYKVDDAVYESYPTEYNAVIDVPAAPYKEGYTFIGWTDYTEGMTMPAKDVEFIAVFEVIEYDAIFDAGEGHFGTVEAPEVDGEGNAVTEKTVPTNYGEAIAAPADPVREGYTFSGWEPVVPGSMPAADTTFTATWSPNTDTPYKVEIYTMNTEGSYEYEGCPVVQNKTGTTGTTAEVTPNAAEGMYVDEAQSILKTEILPDGSTVLKVYYAREEVTVTFDAKGGKLASTDDEGNAIEVETLVYDLYYGAAVAAPADPTLTGYTFKGWEPAVVNKAIEDATYEAQWAVNQYTITFDTDGGSTIDPITDDFGADIPEINDPTKEGYTFVEWVDEKDEPADVPTTMPAEDTALKATWEINKYDISLDAEGGKLADGNETYAAADVEYATDLATYGVPMGEPTKTGYTFLGWSETEGSETAEIAEIPATMPADDIIYYAVWEINEHTITFDTDGGSTIDPITDDFGADIPEIKDPTKEGHTFAGWVDEDGNEATVPTVMPDEDTNLKATWTVNNYKVNYVDREANVAGYPADVAYGAAIPVPATPNNPGYVFLGWYDADGKQPSDYGVMPAGDLEFTAKWSGVSGVEYIFEVYEMKVDGTYPDTATSTTTLTGQIGETVTVSSYSAPEGFTIEESKLTGTIEEGTQLVLYVKAKRNSYVLKAYDGQEADAAELVNKAYLYGAPIDKIADPTRDGYEFAGWVDSADEDEAAATIPVNMPANNITVYATWTKGAFDATFDAGEGAEFPNGEQTVTDPVELGDPIEAPAEEPKKEGYDFIGWAPADIENPTADDVITDGNYGNMDADGEEFVAVWEKSAYKVTFYDYVPTEGGYITPTVTKEIVSAEYDYEEKIVFPSEVDLYGYEHYEFMGWTLAENKPIITDDPALLALLVDTENAIADSANADENGEINYYAVYKRVKVMLIPKNDTCTTVIDRNGLTVDDYVDGESVWYVYGLEEILTETTLLAQYIDVQGDGRIVLEYRKMENGETHYPYTGTGTVINVYDNVTDELVESFTIIIYGDLNGDSFIQAIDAAITEDETLGITFWSLTDEPDYYVHYMLKAGDLGDADGYITAKDAVIIEDTALSIYIIDQVTGEPIEL